MTDVLLRCDCLVIGHDGEPLLPPLDLSLSRGTFVVVVGRNGSGKSTWFKTVLGLLPPVAGRIQRSQPDLRVAFEAQTMALDRTLPLKVADIVAWGRLSKWNFLRPRPRDLRQVCERAMEQAYVTELADRPFRDLSEGQKQRVLLARLLATEPDIALLDEPTSAMDVIAEKRTLAQLCDLTRQRHMLTIVVSHVLGAAAEHADVVVFFDREDQAVVSGPPRDVFTHPHFRKHFGFVDPGPGHDPAHHEVEANEGAEAGQTAQAAQGER